MDPNIGYALILLGASGLLVSLAACTWLLPDPPGDFTPRRFVSHLTFWTLVIWIIMLATFFALRS